MTVRKFAELATICGVLVLGTVSAPYAATAQAHQIQASPAAKKMCEGKSYKSIAKKYYRGPYVYVLRCGNDSFGYRHLVKRKRWSKAFDKKMTDTFWRGTPNDAGGFSMYTDTCPPMEYFRIVYNAGAYHGNGVRPQGVITAYYIDLLSSKKRC
ncbi:hypothetical protein [Wenjunlia tyrosinilytica]|uniref:Secreted protein n=1 Tax=Wenjunlia tyrosinilytica TaxID=1544741 RepID=A0A917ZXJ1_9ACTN|nr:hypothetical protein [Wenjunlia tyrosinilytica]GGP00377.1 hypothetical protein GCM10012280_69010 [Wenjunlia tyrosinilytica]